MNGMTRWLPWGIIAMAGIHTVFCFAVLYEPWADVARAGVFNGIEGEAEREAALWFFYAGIGFFAVGTYSLKAVRDSGRLPWQTALYLLGIGGSMIVVEPLSGGWLVLLLGVLAAVSTRTDLGGIGGQPSSSDPSL